MEFEKYLKEVKEGIRSIEGPLISDVVNARKIANDRHLVFACDCDGCIVRNVNATLALEKIVCPNCKDAGNVSIWNSMTNTAYCKKCNYKWVQEDINDVFRS